ncbi:hypothetical protein [Nonomuraea sp. NPDC005701]
MRHQLAHPGPGVCADLHHPDGRSTADMMLCLIAAVAAEKDAT